MGDKQYHAFSNCKNHNTLSKILFSSTIVKEVGAGLDILRNTQCNFPI